MPCKTCGSETHDRFRTEVAIHLSVDKPLVLIFPEVVVCLSCGRPEFAEGFAIPGYELGLLTKRDTAAN